MLVSAGALTLTSTESIESSACIRPFIY